MATITNVANQLQSEMNLTDSEISNTNLEYLIDNAIDYINLECGTSIADLSGTVASKALTATEDELVVIRACVHLLVRAYLDKGPQVNAGGLGVTQVVSDPHYRFQSQLLRASLRKLCGSSVQRT